MNENKMTKRLLLPFSLALFALLITSVAIIYWQQFNNINKEVISHTQKVQQLFKMKLDQEAKILESQINFLRLNKDLQESYENQDREALLKSAMPFFNNLNKKYQVTHFYFIGLDKKCFLRIHNPERYGDLIPRFTLAEAIENNVPAYGIELGKFGTFTLRLVYPWYFNGKLIGYIELGKEIEHITVDLQQILNVELLFTLNKSFLNRSDWEEGSRMMGNNGNWTLFSDIVIIDKTIPVIPQEVKNTIEEISLHSTHEHLKTQTKLTFNNKQYNSMLIPLIDAGKRELGDIIVLIDISESETLLRTLLLVLISISIVIGAGLLRFFYVFIQGVEAELVKVHDEVILAEKTKAQQDKLVGDKAMRINQALDSATTNILITDSHYDIIYINKAAQQLFAKYESIIQKHLPHFEVKQILGANLAWCHKDSHAQKRKILENIKGSHHTRINIGEMTLEHIITSVTNDDGELFGNIVEFNDRTVEVATEKEINTVIQAASAGDFRHRIILENKEGFFKLFATSVNEIIDFNQSVIEDIMHILSALAEGDLTQQIETDYVGTFEQLKNDINTTVTKLTEVITAMLQTAKIVNSESDQISQRNFNLSKRTGSQAASLEETAATMQQMTATVEQNAAHTIQAAKLADQAKQKAKSGGEIINSTIQAMAKISQSSQKISDIIGVINEIAFQTNLLSLNAAVEAAHAGEQGRGFAVVATEVRNLAQRSAKAAKEIKALIQDSTVKVEEGTKLANQSGEILDKIVFSSRKVSDIISEIAAATQQQSAGIHQINTAMLQMDNVTQQNAALAGEASSTGNLVKEQAQKLEEQVAFFNVGELPEERIEKP
ncbi:MAG: hypothetical protein DRQ57_14765 [Gammaproteobacteria bacterium]|nr:MAG: hypothetical protein DRQ57_14765 [Gammaproteobacteria bacterium]